VEAPQRNREALEGLRRWIEIDYEHTPDGKCTLRLGKAKVELPFGEGDGKVTDDDLGAIDNLIEYIKLTERLFEIME
jgi:hypothetical protein